MVVTNRCKTLRQLLKALKYAAFSVFRQAEDNAKTGFRRRFSTIVTGFVNSLYQNPLYMNVLQALNIHSAN